MRFCTLDFLAGALLTLTVTQCAPKSPEPDIELQFQIHAPTLRDLDQPAIEITAPEEPHPTGEMPSIYELKTDVWHIVAYSQGANSSASERPTGRDGIGARSRPQAS